MKNCSDIVVLSRPADLYREAALNFAQSARDSVSQKGVFTVALSGGETARHFFDALVAHADEQIPWDNIQFYFGDERYLPEDDPSNNAHMADVHLFSKFNISKDNQFRIPVNLDSPIESAKHYEQLLRNSFSVTQDQFILFDLIYLGLGENGHTASLMPGCPLLDAHPNQLVAALWVPELAMYRITLTLEAINHCQRIVFMVTGINKADVVKRVLEGPLLPDRYPPQSIHPVSGKVIWYLDVAAGSALDAGDVSNA